MGGRHSNTLSRRTSRSARERGRPRRDQACVAVDVRAGQAADGALAARRVLSGRTASIGRRPPSRPTAPSAGMVASAAGGRSRNGYPAAHDANGFRLTLGTRIRAAPTLLPFAATVANDRCCQKRTHAFARSGDRIPERLAGSGPAAFRRPARETDIRGTKLTLRIFWRGAKYHGRPIS